MKGKIDDSDGQGVCLNFMKIPFLVLFYVVWWSMLINDCLMG